MLIIRCRKGHFYDGETYEDCPHCRRHARLSGEDGGEREDGETVSEIKVLPGGEVTVGSFRADRERKFVAGWLVCTEGPEKGRAYPLYQGRNRIGRSYRMEVCISEDGKVGRDTHCTVIYNEKKNQFYILEGRGTATCRNGEPLGGQEILTDGDVLELGNSRLEFLAYCKEDRRWK